MNELEVGMYVRTRNGLIFKIVGGNVDNFELDIEYSKLDYFEDTWLDLYKYNGNGGWFITEHCKASFNIIDLIKAGDYVNGLLVMKVHKTYVEFEKGICNDEFIKSIVTKEQFKNMEYKVK